MKSSITVLAGILCLCLGRFAVAAATTEPAEKPSDVISRVYDVRDLIMSLPEFPYTGTMGMPSDEPTVIMGGANNFASEETGPTTRQTSSRQERVDNVIRLIEDTVAPDSWKDNGGTIGSIRELSGVVIVTQSAENHKMIASILSQLRESQTVVRVQADWVMLDPGQLSALLVTPTDKKATPATPRAVDPAALAKAMERNLHFHGEISCYTGQTVSVSSGRTRSVIYGEQPVVAQNAAAMQPIIRQVTEGAVLQITPTVLMATDFAVTEVKSKVAQWGDPSPAAVKLSASTTRPGNRSMANIPDAAVIDRLNVVSQELKCTLRMPLNQPVLVGGMTLEPTAQQPQQGQLYLILQLSVSN